MSAGSSPTSREDANGVALAAEVAADPLVSFVLEQIQEDEERAARELIKPDDLDNQFKLMFDSMASERSRIESEMYSSEWSCKSDS